MDSKVFEPERSEVLRERDGDRLERFTAPRGDLPVVFVEGDPVTIGRQYGALVGDRIRRNADRLVGIFTGEGLPEVVVHLLIDKAWERLAPHVPGRFLAEMEAVSRGAREAGFDVSMIDLQRITAVTNLDLYKREERLPEIIGPEGLEMLGDGAGEILSALAGTQTMSCSMFAVWGTRTVDGKCFSMRNLDWISQSGIHAERLITVCRPSGGNAFISAGYAGVIGCLSGMNEKGISLSEVGAFSVREELDGIPWTLMARQVLEESDTLDAAVAIIRKSRHTLGYNYLVADGDPERFGAPDFQPGAAAIETNFDCSEVFQDDDPKEQAAAWIDPEGKEHSYGVPIEEGVIRADTAFGERTRALQATDDGPGEPENTGNPRGRDDEGSSYTDCHLPIRDMILAYEKGGGYVFPVRGTRVIEAGPTRKIGAAEALTIAATVAHGDEKLDENDWNVMSVVYAPTDLELWVAFESCDEAGRWRNAPGSGYWHLNLKELLSDT